MKGGASFVGEVSGSPGRKILAVAGAFGVALGLYCLGLQLPLIALGVVGGALLVPMPQVFASWASRLLVSAVITIGVLQAGSLVQFFVWPTSSFMALAGWYAVAMAAVLAWLLVTRQPWQGKILTKQDILALVSALIFIIPFTPVVLGNSTAGITNIGGLQSPDAGHHFDFINVMAQQQHLDTSGYPKSFHLSLAFLQQAVVPAQQALSWKQNAILFFSHYILLGGVMACILYHLCISWVARLTRAPKIPTPVGLGVALGLGSALAVLVQWPFIVHGFLNYYFVVIAFALFVVFMGAFSQAKKRQLNDPILLGGALFGFCVSATWPLLLPAIGVTLLLLAWPGSLRALWTWRTLPLLTVAALATVPLYVQLLYPGIANIYAEGALRAWQPLLFLLGFGVVGYAIVRSKPVLRLYLAAIFIPLTVLVGALIAVHLLVLGEVRYFAIKAALLLLVLMVVLSFALCGAFAAQLKQQLYRGCIIVLPLLLLVFVLSLGANPFKDVRDLFRNTLGQGKPAFYDQDAFAYARLGSQDKINYFNATILHYDQQGKKFVAHTLLAQWAQTIKFDRNDPSTVAAKRCHRLVYHNVAYGMGTPSEQDALIKKLKECATVTNGGGRPYYIITDEASLPFIKAMLGNRVEYVVT